MRWFMVFFQRPSEPYPKADEGKWLYQLISAGFQSSPQEQEMIISVLLKYESGIPETFIIESE